MLNNIDELCTGCTACASICPQNCINMIPDNEGFLYPQIDMANCIGCGLCKAICPLINPLNNDAFEPKAYAAYSMDEKMRLESSSGGIFSEIAKVVLNNNGFVYGAAYNKEFAVGHTCIENEKDLYRIRGAKYAQSNLDQSFNDIKIKLDDEQLVMFSGTPCQIAGLKSFLGKEYKKLITVDFICHSVPSPKVWREYVNYRIFKDNNGKFPIRINLRSKETGWSRYKYSNRFEYDNEIINTCLNSESIYMKLFVGGYISRKSCKDCQFKGYKRDSDLTIGDFWGIWDIHPEMDDNKGTSVVLIHSERGQKIWMDIIPSIKCKEVTLEQASQQNPSMLVSSKANRNRDLALKSIQEGNFETCEELFPIPKPEKISFASRVKDKVRRLLYG